MINELLKSHYLFKKYWKEGVVFDFDSVELNYHPTEYVGFYQGLLNYSFPYVGEKNGLLDGTVCSVDFIITSITDEFSLSYYLENYKSSSTNCSIIINATVKKNKQSVFTTRFEFKSNSIETITGNIDYIRSIIV